MKVEDIDKIGDSPFGIAASDIQTKILREYNNLIFDTRNSKGKEQKAIYMDQLPDRNSDVYDKVLSELKRLQEAGQFQELTFEQGLFFMSVCHEAVEKFKKMTQDVQKEMHPLQGLIERIRKDLGD